MVLCSTGTAFAKVYYNLRRSVRRPIFVCNRTFCRGPRISLDDIGIQTNVNYQIALEDIRCSELADLAGRSWPSYFAGGSGLILVGFIDTVGSKLVEHPTSS